MASCDVPDLPPAGHQHLVADDAYIWKDRTTLRVRFLNGDPVLRSRVEAIARTWTKYANLRFDFLDQGEAEIRVSLSSRERGRFSQLGTSALHVPQSEATMVLGGFYAGSNDQELRRAVLHEFGHALGFTHEHQAPDSPIPWNEAAVYQYYSGPPNYWSRETIRANVLQRRSTSNSGTYDRRSIMHYPIPDALTRGSYEVPWNTELSERDKQIAARHYPPKATLPPAAASELDAIVIENESDREVSFLFQPTPTGDWKKRTIEPSRSLLLAGAPPLKYTIRFDSSDAPGSQERRYLLPHTRVKGKRPEQIGFDTVRQYAFVDIPGGLDVVEQEANAPDHRPMMSVASIRNRSRATMTFLHRCADGSCGWSTTTVRPDETVVISIDDGGVSLEIEFDRSFEDGTQVQKYLLETRSIPARPTTELRSEDGAIYQFTDIEGGIALTRVAKR